VIASAFTAGCAVVPQMPVAAPGVQSLSGRMAVRVAETPNAAARSVSASFELQGDARAGSLNLSTPLGTLMAQARWSPSAVTLITPQGQTAYGDLDTLTQQVLGESIPVPALFDWLRGRPWPDAPTTAGSDGGFSQLGWKVDLAGYSQGAIEAVRSAAPAVTVRVRLDR
jgi:outer membrane lipoprotein LolB